jgi:hypothetical protein
VAGKASVSEINTQENRICIEWDSYTLKRMPSEVIEQSEYNGLDWRRMFLQIDEVETSQARDTKEDVNSTIDYLNKEYWWFGFGEEGKRIAAVINKVNCEKENETYNAWEEHLKEVLDFPFNAEIAEPQEKGPFQSGDKVKVSGIEMHDDLYGIIMTVHLERRKYAFPLCELDVIDKLSTNYQPVEDYKIWFANH